MNRQTFLLENLRKYRTEAELSQSEFFIECRGELERILATPQTYFHPGAAPLLRSYLRIVQWNIEKGRRFDAILEQLRYDDTLRWADVILLNEADCGMNRSGNRHVALCLADALGMNMAFAPAHLELTKGVGEELDLAGENRESLQGNAVLSRHPILESCIVPLPSSFEPYEFSEQRYGRRNCVWAKLQLGTRSLWVGAVHLEVRNTPQGRAAQIKRLLERLPAQGDEACLLGGDLNTNGFSRGTRRYTLKASAHLLTNSTAKVMEELRHPERGREPLFQLFAQKGFSWQGLNSWEDTSCASIAGLEDASFLPDIIARIIRRRLRPFGGRLCFKLDWFLGRDIHGLGRGELRDEAARVLSLAPGCVRLERAGPGRISDHYPIFADLRI